MLIFSQPGYVKNHRSGIDSMMLKYCKQPVVFDTQYSTHNQRFLSTTNSTWSTHHRLAEYCCLKTPPKSRKSSKNILAFFIFLVLSCSLVLGASCGDEECYLGYSGAGFVLNVSESYLESDLMLGSSNVYTVGGFSYLIEVTAIDGVLEKATISINSTEKTVSRGENFSFNELRLELINVSYQVGNEETTCPQDCFQEQFVGIGSNFFVGTGICKKAYFFKGVDENNQSLALEIDDETVVVAYYINDSNQYGYASVLHSVAYDQTYTFNLRYSVTTKLLYLEDANQSCHVTEVCASNNDCDDKNPCTIDECDGDPLKCKHKLIAYCKNNDGCCPEKCDSTKDNDCGLEVKCTSNLDCDDANSCTIDSCNGNSAECVNLQITDCTSPDDCCPANCSYEIDTDCAMSNGTDSAPNVELIDLSNCGDKICSVNETQETCCIDCGCEKFYSCEDNICVKDLIGVLEESIKNDPNFKSRESDLLSEGYSFSERTYLKTDDGFDFEYVYIKGDKKSSLKCSVTEDGVVSIALLSPSKSSLYRLGALSLLLLPIIFSAVKISQGAIKRKKEDYYKKMLQIKYGKKNQVVDKKSSGNSGYPQGQIPAGRYPMHGYNQYPQQKTVQTRLRQHMHHASKVSNQMQTRVAYPQRQMNGFRQMQTRQTQLQQTKSNYPGYGQNAAQQTNNLQR